MDMCMDMCADMHIESCIDMCIRMCIEISARWRQFAQCAAWHIDVVVLLQCCRCPFGRRRSCQCPLHDTYFSTILHGASRLTIIDRGCPINPTSLEAKPQTLRHAACLHACVCACMHACVATCQRRHSLQQHLPLYMLCYMQCYGP